MPSLLSNKAYDRYYTSHTLNPYYAARLGSRLIKPHSQTLSLLKSLSFVLVCCCCCCCLWFRGQFKTCQASPPQKNKNKTQPQQRDHSFNGKASTAHCSLRNLMGPTNQGGLPAQWCSVELPPPPLLCDKHPHLLPHRLRLAIHLRPLID